MIFQRTRGLFHILVISQAISAGLALLFCVGCASLFFGADAIFGLGSYPIYWMILVIGLVAEALNRNGQRIAADLSDRSLLHQHGVSLRQTTFAVAALLLYLAFAKDASISRGILVFYLPALYLTLVLTNYALPVRLARRMFQGRYEERTILVGSALKATRLDAWLQNKKIFGLRALGILTDDDRSVAGMPRLGMLRDLERILKEHDVTQAILLELPNDSETYEQMVRLLENSGIRLLILSDLEEKLRHPAIHFRDEGLAFVAPREERLENPVNRLLKRMLDIFVSLPVVIFVLPPLSLLIWILHRIESRGPLFFRQVRAGIQNRQFQIIKFRSMHVDDGDVVRQAQHDSNRVFLSGRWLRQLRVDEIPQFINVLKGEMSVVGPRPHLVQHNIEFAKVMTRYHIRAVVKPGITGLAQVRGFRGDVQSIEDIQHRLESDIYYLENWRLAFDVSIIFRTALQLCLFSLSSLLSRAKKAPRSSSDAERVAVERSPAVQDASNFLLGHVNEAHDVRHILGIRFFTGSVEQAVASGMEGGLVVAPSAPVLLGLERDAAHRSAVVSSRVAITDSGLMVLLWELMTGERITRVSGLAYLKVLLEQPEMREPGNVLWVMPNRASMEKNISWLRDKGFAVSEDDCYVAPEYAKGNASISDPALAEGVRLKRPKHIIMAVGGGVQEKLGADLLHHLDYRPAIHCTGAAIGFLSGDQIRIPMWADRWRLGWLCRCIGEPAKFIPRYWESRKLVNLMFEYHGRLPGEKSVPISSE